MKNPPGTIVNEVTLRTIQGIIDEIGRHKWEKTHKNGVDVLTVDLGANSYQVAIDNGMLSFILGVEAPVSGYINIANEWNMLEVTGTAICLSFGYALKHGVLIQGGIVRETLRDHVNSFGEHSLKFIDQIQQAHQ